MLTRRQFLKWGAGLSALLLPAGCRTLLERIGPLGPTPTSTHLPTLPPPTATFASPLPTATLIAPREPLSPLASPTSPASPSETPQTTVTRSRRTWTAPAGGSKIGFHVVFGPRLGLDECLWWCALSGRPVPVIKCVDDFEAA